MFGEVVDRSISDSSGLILCSRTIIPESRHRLRMRGVPKAEDFAFRLHIRRLRGERWWSGCGRNGI